jgi:ComEC/Rec2-related protein
VKQTERTPVPRRGLYAFAAVAAGILVADACPAVAAPVWFAAACAAVIAAVAAPARRRLGRPLLALAALLVGAGSMSARVLSVPADRLVLSGNVPVLVVRGVVLTAPRPEIVSSEWERPRHLGGDSLRFAVALDGVQVGTSWRAAGGELAVIVRAEPAGVAPGRRVQITGQFRAVEGPANPGQHDARRWAAQEGRVGTLVVQNGEAVEVLEDTPGWLARAGAAVSSAVDSLHQRAADALDAALGPAIDDSGTQSRALLRAMIIGDDDQTLRPVSGDMSRLGIVHILSISGFHLVLVAAVVVLLIRFAGDRGVWEYALAAAAIGLYLLIIPAQAPVVRSGVMVLVLLLTEALGRRYDRLNILAWTACALAIWRPLDLYSPGFQLSFGVTAALIWRANAWTEAVEASGMFGMPGVKGRVRREPSGVWQWVVKQLTGLCVATGIAWTVSSAVVAYHVGVLSLLGVLAGVLLTLPSILAIGAGFLAMLVAVVWPAAGAPLGGVALFFSDITVRGSHLAAQLPASSMTLPQVPLAWSVATTVTAVVAIAPGGWRRAGTRLAALGCVLWLAGIMFSSGTPIRSAAVDRFALPDSSATLVRSSDQAVLIDPGSSAKRSGAFTLRRAVAACGAWRVRTVVVTGPQTERFDHLPELAPMLGVQTVLVDPVLIDAASARPGGDQAHLLRRLDELGIAVRPFTRDETLSVGDVTIGLEAPGVVRLQRFGGAVQSLALTPLQQAEHRELSP